MSASGFASAVRLAFQDSRLRHPARRGVLLAGLTVGAALAAPALAAVGDRIPFQQYTEQVCQSADVCSALVDGVPVNSRLEVNSVSCHLSTDHVAAASVAVASIEFAVLDAGGQIVVRDYAVPVLTDATGFFADFEVNNETLFFAPPGGRVQAVMTATLPTRLSLICTIAGERVIVQ